MCPNIFFLLGFLCSLRERHCACVASLCACVASLLRLRRVIVAPAARHCACGASFGPKGPSSVRCANVIAPTALSLMTTKSNDARSANDSRVAANDDEVK